MVSDAAKLKTINPNHILPSPNSADSMFEPNKETSKTSPKTNGLSDSGMLSYRKSVYRAIEEKIKYQASGDRLSNLPLSIIHLILPRVPVRDAIRTCLLSRQWRYTWTTLPHLLFYVYSDVVDWYSPHDDPKLMEYGESTNKFITSVLRLHKGPIHSFQMNYPFYFGIPNVEEWIHCLSRNDIRELVITIQFESGLGSALSGSSLYSCTKLTKLELWNFTTDPPPSTFKGFLLLRSLHLHCVSLSRAGIECLFANSPLLERLTIMDCQSSDKLRISAPNLKYFSLSDDYIEFCLNAPLLAELFVELLDNDFTPENQSLVCNYYANFFDGITNLVELSGNLYFTQYLSIGIESCRHTLVFPHLKVIELRGMNFEDTKELVVVARLIIGAPNLHKLEISGGARRIRSGASDISFKDLGCAPDFTLEKLRVVIMSGICTNLFWLQLVKFLLESSPVLETMYLGHIYHHHHQVTAELLGFVRASPKAKILLT